MARDDHEVLDVSDDPWLVRLQDAFQWLVTALHLDDDAGGAQGRRIVTCRHCGQRNRVVAVATGVPRCGKCHHALPWIAGAGDDEFADVAEQVSMPVLVDLWASWCGLSCMVRPVVQRLGAERAGEIKVVEVEVVAAPRTSRRFHVCGIPTLMVLRRGEVVARRYGEIQAPALRSWLDHALRDQAESTSDGGIALRTPAAADLAGARTTKGPGSGYTPG
jgi:thioredoxin 2